VHGSVAVGEFSVVGNRIICPPLIGGKVQGFQHL